MKQSVLYGLVTVAFLAGCTDKVAHDASGGRKTQAVAAAKDGAVAKDGQDAFVKVAGTSFSLDGKPFNFQGTNMWGLGLEGYRSEEEVARVFGQFAERGIRVVRIWGFSCRGIYGGGTPILEGVNDGVVQYNERALVHLDATLASAHDQGIKIILTLVNFEPELCGMEWWVHQVTGQTDKQLFYSDPAVERVYKQHVETLLTRINTRRNLAYRDDPTILSVEISNETHTENNYEKNQNKAPGVMVYNWIKDMTAYVRSIDTKHLISTGEEGYRTSPPEGPLNNKHDWIHNGWKGVDFVRNVTIPEVSFATVHIYPDNWNIPSRDIEWVRDYLVLDRAKLAHAAGKPIVLEESGFAKGPRFAHLGYSTNPQYWLGQIYKFANLGGYAGTMSWNAVPTGYAGGDYDFDFSSAEWKVVENQVRYMNDLNQGLTPDPNVGPAPDESTQPPCTDVPPDSTFTCAQQKAWGQCEQAWMDGFCEKTCGKCTDGAPPPCTDVAPDTENSCAQQVAWDKCEEPWMEGFCEKSCGKCSDGAPPPCTDVPPDDVFTCAEQVAWGKCSEAWMANFCQKSCGKC